MADVERIDKETLFIERFPTERYAVITLHRPDRLNAGSPTLFGELAETIQGFDGDDDVQAVVLTGGDSKAFSAGADLGGMTFDSMGDCRRFIRICHEPFEAIEGRRGRDRGGQRLRLRLRHRDRPRLRPGDRLRQGPLRAPRDEPRAGARGDHHPGGRHDRPAPDRLDGSTPPTT